MSDYEERLNRLRARCLENADAIVIYGDREHKGNIMYFLGFDPRFEEALLIVDAEGPPRLIVGNEGMGASYKARPEIERLLCQSFSLMGQDRTTAPNLATVLGKAGLHRGQRVGVVGCKYLSEQEGIPGRLNTAVPSFIIEAIQSALGDSGLVTDVTEDVMDPFDGLRLRTSLAQVAEFEYAASLAAEYVRSIWEGAEVGMSELEASSLMGITGYPLSTDITVIAGREDLVPMRSPTSRKIHRGDALVVGVALWGGASVRAGVVVEDVGELDPELDGYLDFVGWYFRAIRRWHETVRVGVTGSEVYQAVMDELDGGPLSLMVNPGHAIDWEGWVHSPFSSEGNRPLGSGLMFQCDMIPVGDVPFMSWTCNVEDAVCVADEQFRAELYSTYPDVGLRIDARREFLESALEIHPSPDLLPLSNIPAYFAPLVLSRERVLSFAA